MAVTLPVGVHHYRWCTPLTGSAPYWGSPVFGPSHLGPPSHLSGVPVCR
jgi:hypothetical protein